MTQPDGTLNCLLRDSGIERNPNNGNLLMVVEPSVSAAMAFGLHCGLIPLLFDDSFGKRRGRCDGANDLLISSIQITILAAKQKHNNQTTKFT